MTPNTCPRCNVARSEAITGHALRCLNCGAEWNRPRLLPKARPNLRPPDEQPALQERAIEAAHRWHGLHPNG